MNDKQQLQAMGEHQAEQHMCMAKQIEDLQARLQECAIGAAKMQEQRDYAYKMMGKFGSERDDLARQLEAANQQIAAMAELLQGASPLTPVNWPGKCPITRRDFFMEIDGVPTYGGPYDSYTIPEMLGTPEQPWHERELFVRRFDHDEGCWVGDEIIPLRVIHDEVIDDLLDGKAPSTPEGWQLVPKEATMAMISAATAANTGFGTRAQWNAMLAAAPKPEPTK